MIPKSSILVNLANIEKKDSVTIKPADLFKVSR